MNYLREINAFARRMRRAPLSANAQLLWYKLMDTANALRWPDEFQVDNPRIVEMLNLSSIHTARAARKELAEAGLIVFTPGVKGKPSTYHLNSVDALEGPYIPPGPPEEENFLAEVKDDITTYFGYTEALGQELREITAKLWLEFYPKQNPTPDDERKVFYYIKEQTCYEDGHWSMTFPEEKKELLAYAFDQARTQGRLHWGYIGGIYENFRARGIKTIDDAMEYEEKRRRR